MLQVELMDRTRSIERVRAEKSCSGLTSEEKTQLGHNRTGRLEDRTDKNNFSFVFAPISH